MVLSPASKLSANVICFGVSDFKLQYIMRHRGLSQTSMIPLFTLTLFKLYVYVVC